MTSNSLQYTREECLATDDISEDNPVIDAQGNVDPSTYTCEESRKAIIDVCKEFNLILDPSKVSIAHRLKKGNFAKAS